jgi:hypothetical protein
MSQSHPAPRGTRPLAEVAAEHGLSGDALVRAQAAAFASLVEHLRGRTDVQNIDLMELSGMCRNCLSRWLAEGAAEQGVALGKGDAREIVYGMPYEEWKGRFQV